jgi:pimeloyl-ACP methyl ester carboxylesterase
MNVQSTTALAAAGNRSREMLEAYERMLGSLEQRTFVRIGSGRRVFVIEAGEGCPVLFLHGSNTSSLSLLPVLERLEGVRAVAVDRPGFGLSEPVQVPRERFRVAAVEFVDEIADALELDTFAIAGNSMGGTWALWYALARPQRVRRLVLLGSAPLLPGTRCPVPLRMTAARVLGDLLARVLKPNRRMLLRLMASMGEKDTIVRYPDLIEAIVAAGNDPIASAANLAELRAIISAFGFRRSARMRPEELRRLTAPTLLIWGDRDPVGAVQVAQSAASLIRNARLEVLPAGHVPYLGHPKQVADLVSEFVRFGWVG